MDDKKSFLQKQADQLRKLGTEIDELKANKDKIKTESWRELLKQNVELHMKTEAARDNLIQVFFSIKNQDLSE
jgi:hypothetical protein